MENKKQIINKINTDLLITPVVKKNKNTKQNILAALIALVSVCGLAYFINYFPREIVNYKVEFLNKDTASVKQVLLPVKKETNNCYEYKQEVYNEMKSTKVTAAKKFIRIDQTYSGTMSILILQPNNSSDDICLLISTTSESCSDKNAEIIILFTDQTRIILKSHNEFNCNNELFVFLGKSTSTENLPYLKTKKIKAIQIGMFTENYIAYFTEDNQNDFIKIINCLTN